MFAQDAGINGIVNIYTENKIENYVSNLQENRDCC